MFCGCRGVHTSMVMTLFNFRTIGMQIKGQNAPTKDKLDLYINTVTLYTDPIYIYQAQTLPVLNRSTNGREHDC